MPSTITRKAAWGALLFLLGLAAPIVEADEQVLWCVAWSPDGSRFAVGGVNTLWTFNAQSYARNSIGTWESDRSSSSHTVTSVAWHPQDDRLAISGDAKFNGIYHIANGQLTDLQVASGRGVEWNHQGDRLAMASPGDGHLRIWKSDGTLVHDVPRYRDALGLTGVAWDPQGRRLVSIGRYITIHDAAGAVIKQINHRPNASGVCLLLCAEWHPSAKFFAVGDYGNTVTGDAPCIQFWSADGKLMKEWQLVAGSEIRNLSWNAAGTRLASASDKLRIWSAQGELQYEADCPELLWGIDWHPDGTKLLTTSETGRVVLWSDEAKLLSEVVKPDSR